MTQLFSTIEAMKVRRSVRTFLMAPIDPVALNELTRYIASVKNPLAIEGIAIDIVTRNGDGDKPVKLGTYGVIKGAYMFLTLTTPDTPEAITMAGYEMESVILRATALGLSTVWLGGTFRRSDFIKASASMAEGTILPAVVPIGYAGTKRFAERLMRTMVKADKRKPWSTLFFHSDWNTPLTPEEAGQWAEPLEMVRIAPSATNTQPWRILLTDNELTICGDFTPKPGKLDTTMRYLDMGIALCHFDLAARQLHLPGKFDFTAPADDSVPLPYTFIARWRF